MEKGQLKGDTSAFEYVKDQPGDDEVDSLSVVPEGRGGLPLSDTVQHGTGH